jgi:carbon-monoxide dehydrogenase medium subunit
MRIADFRKPAHLEEACAALAELGPKGFALAGATSLAFISGGEEKIAVDITRAGLSGIRRQNGCFQIGSLTRISDLQHHHEQGWALDRVALQLASQQIRNMSTLGGNIARVFPWADFPVALLALNAQVVIGNASQDRVLPADSFFDGQPLRLIKPGELVKRVDVPALPAGAGFGYKKTRLVATGFSIVTAAAYLRLENDRVAELRVAIGAGIPFPARIPQVEAALAGKTLTEKSAREAAAQGLAGLKFKEADGLSAEYVGHLAGVSVGDVLIEAWSQAKEQKP